MSRLAAFAILWLLPVLSMAEISGPATSSDGYFTLRWSWGSTPLALSLQHSDRFVKLEELSATGVVLNVWRGSSVEIYRPDNGTYYFRTRNCRLYHDPHNDEVLSEVNCFVIDTHQVTVAVGTTNYGPGYPEPLIDQAKYNYQVRSGDFDRNGKKDLLVRRLSAGPADGSMQSYIVWNNSNGTVSTTPHSGAYASVAANAPIDNTIKIKLLDINADGFADHVIDKANEVMGAGVQKELAVFAPGTSTNKTRPQGITQMGSSFREFFGDIARWMNDNSYFANNIQYKYVDVYGWRIHCTYVNNHNSRPPFDLNDYNSNRSGRRERVCYLTYGVVGRARLAYGINFPALAAATHMERILEDDVPSTYDMWELSQVARGIIGVHLFGFDDNGNRRPTNHEGDDREQKFESFKNFVGLGLYLAVDFATVINPRWHDYTVETEICQTSDTWCTLENIACWGRHYHAPNKIGGYETEVENGAEVVLSEFGFGQDIHTGVGAAGGLPSNAIGNITRERYFLHNPAAGALGTCPQEVPEQGSGTPPQNCNQVYREPYVQGGKVFMRTRGTGYNKYPTTNTKYGPKAFEKLDRRMKEAIMGRSGHTCPALEQSE